MKNHKFFALQSSLIKVFHSINHSINFSIKLKLTFYFYILLNVIFNKILQKKKKIKKYPQWTHNFSFQKKIIFSNSPG